MFTTGWYWNMYINGHSIAFIILLKLTTIFLQKEIEQAEKVHNFSFN